MTTRKQTTRKNLSLASLAASAAVAVLAFGLATPAAHAQVGFGVSIGSRGYAPNGYVAYSGNGYQRGYWAQDPDGDGNRRWVAPQYVGGYYGGVYAPQYRTDDFRGDRDDRRAYRSDDRRDENYSDRRHSDDRR